ncbi:PREDICTED: uncharacterized protein LOC109476880 [Branchiostoma belcheri]|uniref:Uncharacterized protein LOC109476880 n=1 Tax=Branchiostoma belcheri TaxID=7741 RepID=A0A6P4YVS7_BRABE|nr:PREDICTED: uncharacterized protein LOC109476880 [Branchiostoma belcheri]
MTLCSDMMKSHQCQDDINVSSRKPPVLQITVSGYRQLDDDSLAPAPSDIMLGDFAESFPDLDDVVYRFQYNGLLVLNLTVDRDVVIEVVPEFAGALDRLWSAYQTGRLDRMLQKTLVSEELLRSLGVETVILRSSIRLQDLCMCFVHMTFDDQVSGSPGSQPVQDYVRRHCFALLDSTHPVVAGLNVMSSVPPAWSFILAANLRTAGQDHDEALHKGNGQRKTPKTVCASPVYERSIDSIIQCSTEQAKYPKCTEEEGNWILEKEESTEKPSSMGSGAKEKIKIIAGEGTFVTVKAVGKELIKKQAGSASAAAGIGLTAAFEGVTFARRTAGSVKKLREDKLSGGQFAGEMAKHATKGVFSGGGTVAGATLGQMAIPVPVLGAVIGGVIGNMIGKGAGYVAADVAPDFLMKDGQKWRVHKAKGGEETEPEGPGKTPHIDSGSSDTAPSETPEKS